MEKIKYLELVHGGKVIGKVVINESITKPGPNESESLTGIGSLVDSEGRPYSVLINIKPL